MKGSSTAFLRTLGIGLSAALGAAGVARYALLQRPLSRLDGTFDLAGLRQSVEVVRDDWGVPHMYAGGQADAFFAMGFAHAQDRLWQLELNRRVAEGRLSEIFGRRALEPDRLMRRIGLRSVAEIELAQLDDSLRALLDAYTAGVNAVIEAKRQPLPIEFTILRFQPEPWTALDSIAIGKFMAWGLTLNWDSELIRSWFVETVGPEHASAVEPFYPAGLPIQTKPGKLSAKHSVQILDEYRRIGEYAALARGGLSNAWAIGPGRSATGAAFLASDPHLRPQMPGIWYEAHLCCPGLHVTGITLPGVPLVLIGHNDQIAWGVTVSMADCSDLVIEELESPESSRYRTESGWAEGTVRIEKIVVRGESEPVVERVLVTRHGPIISPVIAGADQSLALQSAALRPQPLLRAALDLNCAQDWEQFRSALQGWGSPSLNFVYADRAGNIGYQLAGDVPIRRSGSGLLPVPGWSEEFAWTGFVPFDELPRVFNPPEGYLVSANNRIVDDDFPHLLGHDWIDGFRARRAQGLIEKAGQVDRSVLEAMQVDQVSEAALELILTFADVEADGLAGRALAILRRWDGRMGADSAGAAIYNVLRRTLLKGVVAARLGTRYPHFAGAGVHPFVKTSSYEARTTGWLIDHLRAADPTLLSTAAPARGLASGQSWPELKRQSLAQAVLELREAMGDDPLSWRWGRLHRLTFQHPLGEVKVLRPLFCRGPFEIGGDCDTLWQVAPEPVGGYDAEGWTASFRQIVDLADFDQSVSMLPIGQSGQPGSPHFDDTVSPFLNGSYHPQLFDRQHVLGHQKHVLILRPGN